MGKYKYVRADVYRRGITIFIGTREELLSFVKEAWPDNRDLTDAVAEDLEKDNALGTTYVEDDGQSIIWIPKFPRNAKGIGVLAHEILHATFTLLDYVDVEYRYGGPNEPYTYLFEMFLTKALNERGYKKFEM